MKRFKLTAFLLIAICTSIFAAKNQSQIKGRILDGQNGEPLSFATISIHTADGHVVTGATADIDGLYIIENVPFGEYILKVSFMGYKTIDKQLSLSQSVTDMGEITIYPDSEQIAQAVITEKVPLIEQKLDKLVMNVSERVSAQGSTAMDILRKAPGISIDIDGNIKLNGQNVAVWIDGRPSHLSGATLETLLKSTEGSTIDKIEIISNPSAKYDAEGAGGIINIKTKKNILKGFNGSISANYGGMKFKEYHHSYGGSLNLNYRGAKTNNFFTYSGGKESLAASINSDLDYGIPDMISQKSEAKLDFTGKYHSFRLGTDLFANKKNTFGYIITAGLRNNEQKSNENSDNYTDIFLNGNKIQSNISKLSSPSSTDNISGNLNYTHIFNEQKGQEITANVDYTYFDLNNHSDQTNTIHYYIPYESHAKELISINSDQYLNILSAKADYQQVFWKTGQIEAGAKWAQTRTDNDMLKNTTFIPETKSATAVHSNFRYTEQIGAAYITMAKMFSPKFIVKAGLRAEYTTSLGDWISSQTKSEKNYFDLFPTLFVSYNPSQNWRTSLTYTKRLSRPKFNQLNPFEEYIDANTMVVGNPELDPQYIHNFTLTAGYSQYVTLYLMISHTNQLIMQTPTFDQVTGMKKLFWENFGKQTMYGAGLYLTELPLIKNHLTFTVGGSYIYNTNVTTSGTLYEGEYKNNGGFVNGQGTLTALLPMDFKIELSGTGMTAMPYGYFVMQPMYYFDLGVKKNLMKNKMTISLTAYDLLRTMKSNADMYQEINGENRLVYKLRQPYEMQKIRLAVTYSFGQAKATRKRNVGNQDEISRVGSNSGAASGGTKTM